MQTEIDILKFHFGSYERVANELGITERHLLNVRKGDHIGKPIERLIKELIAKIPRAKSPNRQRAA